MIFMYSNQYKSDIDLGYMWHMIMSSQSSSKAPYILCARACGRWLMLCLRLRFDQSELQ